MLRISFPPEGLDIAPAIQRLNEKVQELGAMHRREWMTLAVVVGMIIAMITAGPRWLGVVALIVSCTLLLVRRRILRSSAV